MNRADWYKTYRAMRLTYGNYGLPTTRTGPQRHPIRNDLIRPLTSLIGRYRALAAQELEWAAGRRRARVERQADLARLAAAAAWADPAPGSEARYRATQVSWCAESAREFLGWARRTRLECIAELEGDPITANSRADLGISVKIAVECAAEDEATQTGYGYTRAA